MVKKIHQALITFIGPDYRTTISGNLTLLCAGVALYPEITSWIPCPYGDYVRGIAGVFTFVFGSKFSKAAADSKKNTDNKPKAVKKTPPKPKSVTKPTTKKTKI